MIVLQLCFITKRSWSFFCLTMRFSVLFVFFALTVSAFPQQDSLFDSWNQRLDAIHLSNIDRLPIYRFTLDEVRNEVKQYTKTDSTDPQKLSDLHWKINFISTALEQKLTHIDSLFFAKALQFEQEGNEQEAEFYYKRSLDFNPSYCLSVEKLSAIYAKNGQNRQHIELLNFLHYDNHLKDCSLQLFDAAFDSLIEKSNRLIEHRNYYDALKVLDTMSIFLDHLPQEKQGRTYAVLLELAQNGIYSSYSDIISKSIKINKLPLAKEYIYGLMLAIEKNNQQPNQNLFFSEAIQNLIFAHRSNAKMDIGRKQYRKAVATTDSLLIFLDSVNYPHADNLFFDLYSAAYTEQYADMLQNENPLTDDFYQKHSSYIIYIAAKNETHNLKEVSSEENNLSEQDFENEFLKEEKNEFFTSNSLYDRIIEYVFKDSDFAVLDSFFVWKSFLKTVSEETKDSLSELKMKQLMSDALSKNNQYAWSNELLKAIRLLEKIDAVFIRFALQEDSVLAQKNAETTDLLEDRIQKYAREDVQLRLAKAKELIKQQQYSAAYSLLTNNDPIIERSAYKLDTEPLTKQIALPAFFQKEEQNAKELLEMGYFSAGFEKYNQVYAYYKENEIAQYGLQCDNLRDFVEKSNRETYLQQLTLYYIEQNLCEDALKSLFRTVSSGKGNKQWQTEVGETLKKNIPCTELVKKQRFTKEYKAFLDAYFGKKISWRYVLWGK